MPLPSRPPLRFRSLLCMLTVSIISLSLFSCTDEDDPYYSPLVGRWALTDYAGDGNFYLQGLVLYDDGTGYVTGFNDMGAPDSWDVWWSTFRGSTLQISFMDGYGDTWTYYYDFNGGELHLVSVDDPYSEYWYARC